MGFSSAKMRAIRRSILYATLNGYRTTSLQLPYEKLQATFELNLNIEAYQNSATIEPVVLKQKTRLSETTENNIEISKKISFSVYCNHWLTIFQARLLVCN